MKRVSTLRKHCCEVAGMVRLRSAVLMRQFSLILPLPVLELGNIVGMSMRFASEVIHKMMELKVSPNCSMEDGRTPLHEGAAAGSPGVCEVLLQLRADVNACDK
eukprot:5475622-Amphidinium_carterae.1